MHRGGHSDHFDHARGSPGSPPPACVVALAGCGSAPAAPDRFRAAAGGAVDGLPSLHGLGRRRIRRQVVQPARLRGHRVAAADELGVESNRRSSPTREADFAPNIDEPRSTRTATLIVTVGFALLGGDRRGRHGQPRRRLRHRRRRRGQRLRRHDRRPEHQADPVRHGAGRVPRRLRRGGLLDRPAKVGTFGGMNFPTVSIFMDGFTQGVDVLQRAEGRRRQGPRLGPRHRTASFTGGFAANQDAKSTPRRA